MKSIILVLPLISLTAWQKPTPPIGQIPFSNASFEDMPRASACPAGWQTYTDESTPDILPGAWDIAFAPQDGRTCVGLVTRKEGTSEDISQTLPEVLKHGTCYTFSMFLAHSPKYVGYNMPVRLRVWGGKGRGGKDVLLASSPMINHSEWRNYKFQFIPGQDVRYITFEAYFAPGTTFFYNGNIILDHCSPIERCNRA